MTFTALSNALLFGNFRVLVLRAGPSALPHTPLSKLPRRSTRPSDPAGAKPPPRGWLAEGAAARRRQLSDFKLFTAAASLRQ